MSEEILKIVVKKAHEVLDEFISECIGEDGKPKAPSYKSLMKVRGYLPESYKNSIIKKKS
jgi:hypothetical protein